MTERASVNQVVQIGPETVPGTPVAATRRLSGMMITPKPRGDVKIYRAKGDLMHTVAATGKQDSTADVAGVATYDELQYVLSSILGVATITTPAGGTTSRQWKWTPGRSGGAAFKTYTIEKGDASFADQYAFMTFTDAALAFSRDEVGLSGTVQGSKPLKGNPLTGSVASANLTPILGDDVSVYLDPASTGLGTTKLNRAFQAGLNIGGRFVQMWTLDAAQPSIAAMIESDDPTFELTLRMMRNSVSDALFATLDTNATQFVRIEAIGAVIEGAINQMLRIDFAGKLSATPNEDDFDQVYGYDFTFRAMWDATWSKFMEVSLVNTATAL